MARTRGSTKASTHERIVESAASEIRKHGCSGISVANVMKAAGLTHGGFYAHFMSRDDMLEQALDRGNAEGIARLIAAGQLAEPGGALDAIVASYLSDRHVDHPEGGCTLAALGTELARQAPRLRHRATRHVEAMVRLIAEQLPGDDMPDQRARALAMVSSLVGAVVIARLVDDPTLSRMIRDAVTRSIAGDPVRRPRRPRRRRSARAVAAR